jgi:hypothetical protein
MQPSLSRRIWIGAGLAASAVVVGCAPPGARTFAVVLEEGSYLDCFPKRPPQPDIVSLQMFYMALAQAQLSWEARYEAGDFRPAGGTLHAVSEGSRSLAWFEGFQQSQYYPWNGIVFEGDPHDDYVDVTNTVSYDADASDPNDIQLDCGVLTESESNLLATIDGHSLEGRIHRIEYVYFGDATSACAAFFTCSRSLALTGAEEQ